MTSCLIWLHLLLRVAAQHHLSLDYLLLNKSNEIKEKGCDLCNFLIFLLYELKLKKVFRAYCLGAKFISPKLDPSFIPDSLFNL